MHNNMHNNFTAQCSDSESQLGKIVLIPLTTCINQLILFLVFSQLNENQDFHQSKITT